MTRMKLPEIMWHRARMKYVAAILGLAECGDAVKMALAHHAERIAVNIARRLVAAGRGQ